MSQVKICNKVIDNPKHEFIAKALDDISSGKGVFYFDAAINKQINYND